MLLLDTHAAIWLADGAPLSPEARRDLNTAVGNYELLFSAVSAWEIGLLEERSLYAFKPSAREWVERFVRLPGIRSVALDSETALSSTTLPANFHRDPADRFLVAIARHLGAALVTRDERILAYAKLGHLRALRC